VSDFLSVIIPTLDEAPALQLLIPHLRSHMGSSSVQLILADGGSADPTREIAQAAGIEVVQSQQRGRAHQLNEGARHAHGSAFLFLHADTLPPVDFIPLIQEALDAGAMGGAFARRFHPGSPLLSLTCQLADWRSRTLGWFLGDQAIFVRRNVFFQLGGFRPLSAFEDLDFSQRIASLGPTHLIDSPVSSSDRRFHRRGALGQTFFDLCLTLGYFADESRFYDAGPR
jgi:rSAM/selenodomain-associated transferase 2